MNKKNPDGQVQILQDLFRSLQLSLMRLRQEIETFRERLVQDGECALKGPVPAVNKLEGLIRDCQKVERALAEFKDGSERDAADLDLEWARREIHSRLDRLRAAHDAGDAAG